MSDHSKKQFLDCHNTVSKEKNKHPVILVLEIKLASSQI